LSRGFCKIFTFYGKEVILISLKYERYDIKGRAAMVGISLKDLLDEANKRTGCKMDLPRFTRARRGQDRSPSAELTLETADAILKEQENKRKEGSR
jgi:hypothetical protein